MASHSGRPGAIRKKGTKKGAQVGTGGHSRRRLEGKGPTPKAEDRTYHPAYKRKVKREAREAQEAAIARARAKSSIRVKPGHELIAGRNPVAEAARASVPIERVFILDNVKDDRVEEVVRLASAMGAPVYEVTRRDLDVATDGAVHQGVAIEVRGYEYADASDLIAGSLQQLGHPLLVALDQVTDPHNLGAVLRSAGAFGADGVIIPERRSAGVNTTAWKVSAGAAARVPVARATNLVRALEEAKAAGYFVVGLDGGGDAPLRGLSLADGPLVVVTGAEGAGLSRLVRETCDQIVSIPIASTVESLNAAVATGIALYEVASLRAHHARHAAGRREQAHARRQRRDVAFREPLRARSPLLVEVRAAHRAHDALELGRVETCGPIAFGALLDADDEADGLPRPERHEHGAADLDRLVARFFRDGVGIRRVERLRGYVQDDGCEFHAPSISQPRAAAGTLPLHRRKSLGIPFAPAAEHAIRC